MPVIAVTEVREVEPGEWEVKVAGDWGYSDWLTAEVVAGEIRVYEIDQPAKVIQAVKDAIQAQIDQRMQAAADQPFIPQDLYDDLPAPGTQAWAQREVKDWTEIQAHAGWDELAYEAAETLQAFARAVAEAQPDDLPELQAAAAVLRQGFVL